MAFNNTSPAKKIITSPQQIEVTLPFTAKTPEQDSGPVDSSSNEVVTGSGTCDAFAVAPSTMARFESCELLWGLKNVLRVEVPERDRRVTTGELFHAVAASLMELPRQERNLNSVRHITQSRVMELSRTPLWEEMGYGFDEEIDFGLRVWDLVETWFSMEDVSSVDVVSTESTVEAVLFDEGDMSGGGVVIRGVLDRCERRSDGKLVIVDYKTGRAPGEKDSYTASGTGRGLSSALGRDFGLSVYALALEEMDPTNEVAEVRLLYVGSGNIVSFEWGDFERTRTRELVVSLGAKMREARRTGVVVAKSGRHCLGCAYQDRCPIQKDTPTSLN